ncbi:MAG: lipoyl(octanoyl) transferase LipB [Ignavibacteria bacterium]|nr:lipoyl(octanoyl) transferase LipB [Ignavibacteria bacterium]
MKDRELKVINLKIEPYKKIWDYQYQIQNLRLNGKISDVLILLEHSHVYTLGKVAKREHLLINPQKLTEEKIDLFEIDRGGDITYHGPGQIVGYPIIKLDDLYQDLHRYLRELEEVIILTLKEYGVDAYRIPGLTGVWVKDEKIAAIGIKITRWVTMHGFAFNINTDLSYFHKIIPCGIKDKGVTSLQKILGREIDIEEVKKILVKNFVLIFKYDEIETLYSLEEILSHTTEKISEGI